MSKVSDATKAKMRARWSPERCEAQRQRMLGNKINFGKHHSAKTRSAIGKAQDGVPCPQRGRPGAKRPEAREAQRRRWSVPGNKQRQMEKMKRYWSDPEWRAKLSVSMRNAYRAHPERLVVKAVRMRQLWADGKLQPHHSPLTPEAKANIAKSWTQDRKELQSIRNRVLAKMNNPNSKARYSLAEYARLKSAMDKMTMSELKVAFSQII